MEVPDEIFKLFETFNREQNAFTKLKIRNKAYYSLDAGDGIEAKVVDSVKTPADLFFQKLTNEQLYMALASLPEKQARRVTANYLWGMSKADISRLEGVSKKNISYSIEQGLTNLKKYFEKNFQ